VTEIIQLGELDDPYSTGLHGSVFAAQIFGSTRSLR